MVNAITMLRATRLSAISNRCHWSRFSSAASDFFLRFVVVGKPQTWDYEWYFHTHRTENRKITANEQMNQSFPRSFTVL